MQLGTTHRGSNSRSLSMQKASTTRPHPSKTARKVKAENMGLENVLIQKENIIEEKHRTFNREHTTFNPFTTQAYRPPKDKPVDKAIRALREARQPKPTKQPPKVEQAIEIEEAARKLAKAWGLK